jgi:ATP-binding cassette subfamily B protein
VLRLFADLKPFRRSIAVVLLLALAQSIANLYLPRLTADIVDHGIARGDNRAILSIGIAMLVIALVATGCAAAGSYFAARVAAGFGRIIRSRIFGRVEHFSLHQFSRFSTASLITRTTNDTTQVQQVLIMILNLVISAPMMAIGGVILALAQDVALAWILIAAIPIIAVVFLLIMWRAVPLFKAMQSKLDKLNLVLDEGLTGVRVIRAFDRAGYEHERFDAANLDLTTTAIGVNRLLALLMPAMMLMLNLTSVIIIWFGSIRIDAGAMQVGAMIASLQYAMQILFAVFMVAAMIVMLPRAAASATRINEVLDVAPEVTDPATPKPAGAERGHVEFDNVTFQYPGAEEPALSGVSFTAHPGR